MRLARGSGPAGLAGMARLSPAPWPGGEGLSLARPLLDLSKAELVAFCRAEGLSYFDDPTNADVTFRRPQLRRLAALLAAEGLGRAELTRLAARAARAEQALAPAIATLLAALPARRAAGLFEAPTDCAPPCRRRRWCGCFNWRKSRESAAGPRRGSNRSKKRPRACGAIARLAATLGGVAIRLRRQTADFETTTAAHTRTRRAHSENRVNHVSSLSLARGWRA